MLLVDEVVEDEAILGADIYSLSDWVAEETESNIKKVYNFFTF